MLSMHFAFFLMPQEVLLLPLLTYFFLVVAYGGPFFSLSKLTSSWDFISCYIICILSQQTWSDLIFIRPISKRFLEDVISCHIFGAYVRLLYFACWTILCRFSIGLQRERYVIFIAIKRSNWH